MSLVQYVRSELRIKPGRKLSSFDRNMLETARILDKLERMYARRKKSTRSRTLSAKRPARKRR